MPPREKRWRGPCPNCGGLWAIVTKGNDGKDNQTLASLSDFVPKPRISTGFSGFDEVLGGGGLVRGSTVLLSGGPGLGKSTMILQSANRIAESGKIVLFASGEQNSDDIGEFAHRLGVKSANVKVLGIDKDGGDIYSVTQVAEDKKADVLVIDSLQTAQLDDVEADEGSPNQCKAVANYISAWGKRNKASIILICQVTKDGQSAGPMAAQHFVDTLLDFIDDSEIDADNEVKEDTKLNRLLMVSKNRNGPSGIEARFKMTDTGIEQIRMKSKLKLVDR